MNGGESTFAVRHRYADEILKKSDNKSKMTDDKR